MTLEAYFDKIESLKKETKKRTALLLGTTVKIEDSLFYTTPIRQTDDYIIGGIVYYDINALDSKIDYIEQHFNTLFIDIEVKNRNFKDCRPWEVISEKFQNIRKIPYKSNDLTVLSFRDYFNNLFFDTKKAIVIGAGNIGAKLAIHLVENGIQTYLFRRDVKRCEKIVEGINATISEFSTGKAHLITDIDKEEGPFNLVVLCTPGIPVFGDEYFEKWHQPKYLVDIGKGCFETEFLEKKIRSPLFRLDVSHQIEKMVDHYNFTYNHFSKSWIERALGEITVVPSGLLARKDEIIVDRVENATQVYGISNGCGDLVRNLSDEQKLKIQAVIEFYGIKA